MKRFLLMFTIILASIIVFGQNPPVLNYQGIARNEKGQPYSNTEIRIKIQIRQGTQTGLIAYSETRTVTTNAQGLFSILINGEGAETVDGTFDDIIWWQYAYYLETLIDIAKNNTYVSIGTTRLVSVPYSLTTKDLQLPFSKTATLVSPLLNLQNNGLGPAIRTSSSLNNGIEATTTNTTGRAALYGNASNAGGVGVQANSVAGGIALKVQGPVNIGGAGMSPGAGKVLTSDANGNATWQYHTAGSAFRASGLKGNVYQKVEKGSFTKVLFYEVDRYDIGNEYDASFSMFFPKETGIYHLNTQIKWLQSIQFCRLRLMLLRNGVSSELGTDWSGTNGTDALYESRTGKLSLDIVLQKNDAVWVEALFIGSPEGHAFISQGGADTWFSGHLIQKL